MNALPQERDYAIDFLMKGGLTTYLALTIAIIALIRYLTTLVRPTSHAVRQREPA